jgi:hypothetical protein
MAARAKKGKNAKRAKKASRGKGARSVKALKARTVKRPARRKPPVKKAAVRRTTTKKRARATARPARAAQASAAKRAKARAKPLVRREDHAGHLDPKYAAELRRQSGRAEPEPSSFLDKPRSKDDLVEELGEEFVGQATSGEYAGEDLQDQQVPEERGGPFVETAAGTEFAEGTDPSNPKGATREPFPRT